MLKLIKETILAFGAFLLVMLIVEVFLHGSKIVSTSPTDFDENIGRCRRTNFEYVIFNEGFGIVRFNKQRFIGKDVSINKPKGVIRIALLGDSFVEGYDVFERSYFATLASKMLHDSTDYDFEFMNFGRSGFDFGDMFCYDKNLVAAFNPDFTFYFLSNDDLQVKNSDNLRPKLILDKDSLIISTEFNKKLVSDFQLTKPLTQNSHFFNMISSCYKKYKQTVLAEVLFEKFYYLAVSKKKSDHSDKPNVEDLSPVVRKIADNLNAHQVVFFNRDSKPLNSQFTKLITEKNFRYHDLSLTLNAMKRQGINPYSWPTSAKEGHWNHSAHKEIAVSMQKFITNNLIVNYKN